MWTSLAVFLIAAVMCAGVAFWVLRAYRLAGGGARSGRSAMLMCGAVSLVALGVYLAIGRPELPDAPYQQRLNTLLAGLRSSHPPPLSPDEALAVWTHLAREHPGSLQAHLAVADLLQRFGRFREATMEYDKALHVQPTSADALLGMGRALTGENGRISPDALHYFQLASANGDAPEPWLYQATAAMQAGDDADARRFWGEAARRFSADNPMHDVAERMSRGEQP